ASRPQTAGTARPRSTTRGTLLERLLELLDLAALALEELPLVAAERLDRRAAARFNRPVEHSLARLRVFSKRHPARRCARGLCATLAVADLTVQLCRAFARSVLFDEPRGLGRNRTTLLDTSKRIRLRVDSLCLGEIGHETLRLQCVAALLRGGHF